MESSIHKPLTDRQERFVFEYLIDLNASAAAERAGYSARSRASQASVLMADPAVRERIRIEMQSLLAELRLTALDLMKERMRAGFFRAGKLFDSSGRLLGFEEMEQDVRDALVIGGKWRKGEPEVRFRMPNREPALRALERVHERLDKLNEAHYAALEKERAREQWQAEQAPAQGAVPAGMWTALNLEQPAPLEQGGGRIESPVPQAEEEAPPDNFAENSHVFSGSATTSEVKPAAGTTTVVPLTRVSPTKLAGEIRRNAQARGGRSKPEPLHPQGLPPPSLAARGLAAVRQWRREVFAG